MTLVPLLFSSLGIVGIMGSILLLLYAKKKLSHAHALLAESEEKLKNVRREIENEKREALLRVKDEIYKKRSDFDAEMKRDRAELERLQAKLNSRYEAIEKKSRIMMNLNESCNKKNVILSRIEDTLRANETKLKISLYRFAWQA